MAAKTSPSLGKFLRTVWFLELICCALCATNSKLADTNDNFPKESLSCKLYNLTILDCSYRALYTIPSLHKWTPKMIDLSFNNIGNISNTTFTDNLQGLEILRLEENHLRHIDNGVFKALGSLKELYLYRNDISSVAPDGLTGLRSLVILDLSYNNLAALQGGILSHLGNLRTLNLSYNHLEDIPNKAIAPLRSLEILNLHGNIFNTLSFDKTFTNLVRLSWLLIGSVTACNVTANTFQYLSTPTLTSMSLQFRKDCLIAANIFEPLRHLRQFEILLPNISTLASLKSPLQELTLLAWDTTGVLNSSILAPLFQLSSSLRYLHIILKDVSSSQIEENAFTQFPHLNQLKISGSQEISLFKGAFYGLDHLRVLDLSQNRFRASQLKNSLHELQQQSSLTYLDLSYIALSGMFSFEDLPYGVRILDLSGNYLIAVNCTENPRISISELILEDMSPGSFGLRITFNPHLYLLRTLKMSQIRTGSIETIFDYPVCQQATYISVINVSSTYGPWTLSSALGNTCKNLEILDISDTNVLDHYQSDVSAPELTTLHVAHNKLTSINQILFIKAPKLRSLDLSNNIILSISEENMQQFANLLHINLENNKLLQLDSLRLLIPITTLKLGHNSIKSVPKTFFSQNNSASLATLDLNGNLFQCDCSIESFKTWILQDSTTQLIPGDGYRCITPDQYFGLSITGISLDCESQLALLILEVGSASGLVCLTIIMVLIYRFRKRIRHTCYIMIHGRSPPLYNHFNTDLSVDDDVPRVNEDIASVRDLNPRHVNYMYDAYLAHHGNSSDWVHSELLPNIEKSPQPYRLCLPNRDLPPTDSKIDQMTQAILNSAKVIVLFTNDFVHDEWAKIEILMAHKISTNEKLDLFIFVFLEDIRNSDIPLFFRKILGNKNTIKWPSESKDKSLKDLFWCQLRRELCKPVKLK